MKEYPRFQIYKLYTQQKSACQLCNSIMNLHDMETENIVEDQLLCHTCIEEKKMIISNYDDITSITDMNLNVLNKYFKNTSYDEFEFSNTPLILGRDLSYVNESYEEEERESEIDPEEKILSSWYHRAMLNDEYRELYDDGNHIDFDAVEEFWKLKHEEESHIEIDEDLNSQLVFDYKY